MNKRSVLRMVFGTPMLTLLFSCAFLSCTQDIQPQPDAGTPTTFCENDAECDLFATCVAGVCVASDIDPDADCQSTADCPNGTVCDTGECVAPPGECATSEDCPGGLLCNGFSDTCYDPNDTGCDSNESCAAEPQCAGVTCICNADGSCSVSDEPPPPQGSAVDLGGFTLLNLERPDQQIAEFENGIIMNPGDIIVIGRDATLGEFEQYWGTILGSDVEYLVNPSPNSGIPIVNGGEEWELLSATGSRVDITIEGDDNSSYQRISNGNQLDLDWLEVSENDATPGEVDLPTTGVGLVISEWSDASGSGNFPFEFIELYYAP